MGLIDENRKIRKSEEKETKKSSSETARKDREAALGKLEQLAYTTAGVESTNVKGNTIKGEGLDPNKRLGSYKHYISRYRKGKLTDKDHELYNQFTKEEQTAIQELLYKDKETRRLEREEGVDHQVDRWAIESGTYDKDWQKINPNNAQKSSQTNKKTATNTNGSSTNKNVATVTGTPQTVAKQSPLVSLFKDDSKKKTVVPPKPTINPFLPLEKLMS